jgi:hypothetical protein
MWSLRDQEAAVWAMRIQKHFEELGVRHQFDHCDCRGATPDGSRGFQPTVSGCGRFVRRGATGEWGVVDGMIFRRRSATRDAWGVRFRGLKPTATTMGSLRDQETAALAKKIRKNFEGLGV